MSDKIILEFFTSSFCHRCLNAKQEIKNIVAATTGNKIEYREVDVVEELDYSVSLGVLKTPSIAINGELVFTSMPNANELKKALEHQKYSG